MKHLIGYIRVSTKEQGRTKNGLEAQRAAILRFADEHGYHVVKIVEEVASGGDDDRPMLAEVVATASKMKYVIVVNKLDRLSRSAAYILNLMNSTKSPFIVTELGEDINKFMLHIYAAVAEQEREMIRNRTKAALEAKKARGEPLGASADILAKASEEGRRRQIANADAFAMRLKPVVEAFISKGMSLRQIADKLNQSGTATARGGNWAASTVKNLIARY